MPGTVPRSEATPSSESPSDRSRVQTYFVIRDASGIIVALSDEAVRDIDVEHPVSHAAKFLLYLMNEEALAGQVVVQDVLRQIYVEKFCRPAGIRPLPWRSVLLQFNQILRNIGGNTAFKAKLLVYRRGQPRKVSVYRIPRRDEGATEVDGQGEPIANVA